MEVMQQHVHGPRPRLPAKQAQYEPLLESFMARVREERFADANSAAAALTSALDRIAEDAPLTAVAAQSV